MGRRSWILDLLALALALAVGCADGGDEFGSPPGDDDAGDDDTSDDGGEEQGLFFVTDLEGVGHDTVSVRALWDGYLYSDTGGIFRRYAVADGAREDVALGGNGGGSHNMCGTCQLGPRLYYLGGGGGGLTDPVIDPLYEVADLAAESWLEPGSALIPYHHGGGTALDEDHCLLVGGDLGVCNETAATVQVLDPTLDDVDFLEPLPEPRNGPAALVFDDTLLVCGGGRALLPDDTTTTGSHGFAVGDCWLLDRVADDGWTAGATLPMGLIKPALVRASGRVWALGGEANWAEDPIMRQEVYSWAPGEEQWRYEWHLPGSAYAPQVFADPDGVTVWMVVHAREPEPHSELYRWVPEG